jgi:hypothetical protein
MDPIKNPFSPGAGSPPPELVGREPILEQARVLLGRIRTGKSEKSLLLTGLRGVGKTVLLNEIRRMAKDDGYRTIFIEAHENKALGPLLATQLKAVFFELDRIAHAGDRVKRGLRVLRSFVGGLKLSLGEVEIGLDIEPERGAADSGDIEQDLPNLFEAAGEAASRRGAAVHKRTAQEPGGGGERRAARDRGARPRIAHPCVCCSCVRVFMCVWAVNFDLQKQRLLAVGVTCYNLK